MMNKLKQLVVDYRAVLTLFVATYVIFFGLLYLRFLVG